MNDMEDKKKMTVDEYSKFLLTIPQTELAKKVEPIEREINWGGFQKKHMADMKESIYMHLIGFDRYGDKIPPMATEETALLKAGLLDLADRIRQVADTID